MNCKINKPNCGCEFNLSTHGICNPSNIVINGSDRTQLNWSEVSVPEVFTIPAQKPIIEQLDKVFVNANLNCVKLIETPFSYEVYDVPAAVAVITDVLDLLETFEVIDVTLINAITTAITNLLAGLDPTDPLVIAVNTALGLVTSSITALQTLATSLVTLLTNITCIGVTALIEILNQIVAAAEAVISALEALAAAVIALVNANPLLAALGLLATQAITALITAINALIAPVLTEITTLTGLVEQYFVITPNAEGTCLTGRKIIIEGVLEQKVVYTALVDEQSVHSASNEMPFTAYIIPYAKFEGIEPIEVTLVVGPNQCETVFAFPYDPNNFNVDLCEDFCVDVFIEDIFAYAMDERDVFKNITLFLQATPTASC